jgi:putative hydrolase of HD superfamily
MTEEIVISKDLIEQLYDSANSQRWNDHLRPQQGFTELDKQAHKMIIAYVLARYEEDRDIQINWRALLEGGLFEFLHRTVVTDIKPPVYYEIRRGNSREMDEWVIDRLHDALLKQGADFAANFTRYFREADYSSREKRILKAAHYLATNWEFKIVYRMNKDVVVGIEDTRQEILSQIEDYYDLIGVQKLSLNGKTQNFIDLVGQLRFQKRWAQSPRIPETSVMGHMLIVAVFAYFCARALKASDERLVNEYLCGLFHDLPEVLTRDIISPVKRSATGIEDKIKEIEANYMRSRIFPLLPDSWHEEVRYFTENEFQTRVLENGRVKILDDFTVPAAYDRKEFRPVDGRLLKCCDNLAALVEAVTSYNHGVFSKHLLDGIVNIDKNISGMAEGKDIIGGIDFRRIMDEFSVRKIIEKEG